MVNLERVQRWVDALESGEFKQAREKLTGESIDDPEESGYCCLGVLCELYRRDHPHTSRWNGDIFVSYGINECGEEVASSSSETLTEQVSRWAGFSNSSHDRNPILFGLDTASELNDIRKFNFREIAKFVRQKFLGTPAAE